MLSGRVRLFALVAFVLGVISGVSFMVMRQEYSQSSKKWSWLRDNPDIAERLLGKETDNWVYADDEFNNGSAFFSPHLKPGEKALRYVYRDTLFYLPENTTFILRSIDYSKSPKFELKIHKKQRVFTKHLHFSYFKKNEIQSVEFEIIPPD